MGNIGNDSPPPSATTYKFPALHFSEKTSNVDGGPESGTSYSAENGSAIAQHRWHPRRASNAVLPPSTSMVGSAASTVHREPRHGRQKSITEAIKTIRTRKGSIGHNAHEIADSLKAPVSPAVIILCIAWYTTSILSNTSSKMILMTLPKPITLTLAQFAFVSSWCIVAAWFASIYRPLRHAVPALRHGIQWPSRDIVLVTLPLTAFQIGGHVLHTHAMTRIPVSLVHTIKGLSPLFTVLAYKIFFRINYSASIYLSLVPLTLGVILACSAEVSGNLFGLIAAFGSALLFVTQNIVSKKLFNEAAKVEADPLPQSQHQRQRKPDKLNLLCYSSGLAFLFTCPLWLWSEGFGLVHDFLQDASVDLSGRPGAYDHGRLTLEFIFNGTFHFLQSLVAFALLSLVSPVTYSVASQIKRVAIVLFALVWFGNRISGVQATGITLTFLGLYLYDRSSDSSHADRRASRLQMRADESTLLPLVAEKKFDDVGHNFSGNVSVPKAPAAGFSTAAAVAAVAEEGARFANGSASGLSYAYVGSGGGDEKANGFSSGQMDAKGVDTWLAAGTKQEDTWKASDLAHQHSVTVT